MDTSVLDSIFTLGADNVLIAQADNPAIKDGSTTVTNILGDAAAKVAEPKTEEHTEEAIVPVTVPANDKKAKDVLGSITDTLIENPDTQEDVQEPVVTAQGRPKTEKNALVSYLASKIEANEFGIPDDAPYDAAKQTLPEYLSSLPEKDLHAYLDANIKAQVDDIRETTPKEFYDSLPEELQYLAAYVADGGQNLKGVLQAMTRVEEVRAMDPAVEADQVPIVRAYLQSSTKLTQDQIAEQIEEWKEGDKLEKRAREFKPQLDEMQKEQVVAYQKQQQEVNKQRQELQKFYATNVYKALENNELAGVKLDKKFAREIADNMISTAPSPYDGRPVNWLGYGLDKCQFTEPDYEAVMLASWILNNKPAALEAIRQQGATQQTEKVAKLIKMGQGLGTAQAAAPEPVKTVKRINTSNVLKRSNA